MLGDKKSKTKTKSETKQNNSNNNNSKKTHKKQKAKKIAKQGTWELSLQRVNWQLIFLSPLSYHISILFLLKKAELTFLANKQLYQVEYDIDIV